VDKHKLNITVLLPLERLLAVVESSEILGKLDSQWKVTLLLPDPLIASKQREVVRYRESKAGETYRDIILNANTMRHSSKVKSFETRIRNNLGLHLSADGKYQLNLVENLQRLLTPRTLLSYWAYQLSKSKLIETFLRGCTLIWPSFIIALLKSKPNMVVIFSGGAFTGVENICLTLCRLLRIPNTLIIDNWDNLNSKSIFLESPTGLGVWGKSMENDARQIHNMRPKVLSHIGSARFRPNENQQLPIEKEFLLFAGSGKPVLNEINAVLKVREFMDNCQLSHLDLIYRPHPISGMDLRAIASQLQLQHGIQIDPSFEGLLKDNFYQPGPLHYLESLCKYARIVIAPQSTIIVESLSLGTPVISLNWSEVTPGLQPLEEYTHFKELYDSCGFFAPRNYDELNTVIRKVLSLNFGYNLVPFILPTFHDSYSERVLKLISETYLSFGEEN